MNEHMSLDLIEDDTIRQNTEAYIDTFIDINRFWNNSISTSRKIKELSRYNVSWDDIAIYIRYFVAYEDFLFTPYWKAIAEKTKQDAGYKCQICNSNKNLATHHKTYKHHGYELFYMKDDLVVLCDRYHKKFHDILEGNPYE